ncbi:MAG: PH domain-containing protein [Syntrophomonadaceae bacterium]|nr:PH domain-containing protein [Syntrophomonadaceae bacterium]
MEFTTRKSSGPWVGLLAGVIIFTFTLWGVGYSLGPEDMALKIMLYVPTYLFLVAYIYLIIGAFNLHYRINDEHLTIRWGLLKKSIYWQDVNEIIIVKGKANLFPFLSVQWPGYIVGLFTIKGLGPVRMYGTHVAEEFLYLKTGKGFFGLTPYDMRMADFLESKTSIPITIVDMDEIPAEVKGTSYHEDDSYKLFYRLNLILLLVYIVFMAIFYPGSGADPITVLLLVLAIPLFFFNVSNASRIIQFSESGAYMMLILGVLVTGIFLILTASEILL